MNKKCLYRSVMILLFVVPLLACTTHPGRGLSIASSRPMQSLLCSQTGSEGEYISAGKIYGRSCAWYFFGIPVTRPASITEAMEDAMKSTSANALKDVQTRSTHYNYSVVTRVCIEVVKAEPIHFCIGSALNTSNEKKQPEKADQCMAIFQKVYGKKGSDSTPQVKSCRALLKKLDKQKQNEFLQCSIKAQSEQDYTECFGRFI